MLGALTSLSLPPYNYLFINFFTLGLFFIFIFQKKKFAKKQQPFVYGWFFGFGYFLTNLYWITISLTFDENYNYLIPLALVLIPSFLALFYGLATYCFFLIKIKKPLSNLFLFSLLFGLTEFLRGNILTGFPWNLIAYSFSNQIEILNITSIIGTYSFNLFCISLFTSPSIFILRENKKDISICVAFLITTMSFYILGSQNLEKFNNQEVKKLDYKLRILSSNISIDRFYNNIDPITAIEELIEISSPKKNEKIIFIWPEGIIPGISQDQLKEYKWLFENKFNENHLLAIGINSKEDKNKTVKYFNSLSIFDHDLNVINSYKKINLVPFGEFLPFEKTLKKFGLKSLTNNYNSYTKGRDRKIITIFNSLDYINLLPLICYEIMYSGYLSELNDFDYIVNISEDGWFGDSIGPYQHFAHTIFRSIESGKYTLRSTNNGISAIVNPLGKVLNQIPIGFKGSIVLDTSKKTTDTLFSRLGNKMFIIVIFIYIFLIFSFNKLKNE